MDFLRAELARASCTALDACTSRRRYDLKIRSWRIQGVAALDASLIHQISAEEAYGTRSTEMSMRQLTLFKPGSSPARAMPGSVV